MRYFQTFEGLFQFHFSWKNSKWLHGGTDGDFYLKSALLMDDENVHFEGREDVARVTLQENAGLDPVLKVDPCT